MTFHLREPSYTPAARQGTVPNLRCGLKRDEQLLSIEVFPIQRSQIIPTRREGVREDARVDNDGNASISQSFTACQKASASSPSRPGIARSSID